jgi:hypothetical protein
MAVCGDRLVSGVAHVAPQLPSAIGDLDNNSDRAEVRVEEVAV